MQKAPEIHAKYDPVLRIKSYAKNTRNSRKYDPVLRVKNYAKNTRNSRKMLALY